MKIGFLPQLSLAVSSVVFAQNLDYSFQYGVNTVIPGVAVTPTSVYYDETNGYVYITGTTSQQIDNLAFQGDGYKDVFVAAYYPNSTRIWTSMITGLLDQLSYFITQIPGSSDLLITGSSYVALWNQSYGGGSTDGFIARFSSNGSFVYGTMYGGTVFDTPVFADVLPSSDTIYVFGKSYAMAAICQFSLSNGSFSGFTHLIPNNVSAIYGAARSSTPGYYYVTGTGGSAFDGCSFYGGSDIYLTLASATNSSRLWSRTWGSANTDNGNSVAFDESTQRVFIVGSINSVSLNLQPTRGGIDAFIMCLDANGNLLWTVQFGTSKADIASSVVIAGPGGNVFVVGYMTNPYTPGKNTTTVSGYLGEFTQNGTLVDMKFPSAAEVLNGMSIGRVKNNTIYLNNQNVSFMWASLFPVVVSTTTTTTATSTLAAMTTSASVLATTDTSGPSSTAISSSVATSTVITTTTTDPVPTAVIIVTTSSLESFSSGVTSARSMVSSAPLPNSSYASSSSTPTLVSTESTQTSSTVSAFSTSYPASLSTEPAQTSPTLSSEVSSTTTEPSTSTQAYLTRVVPGITSHSVSIDSIATVSSDQTSAETTTTIFASTTTLITSSSAATVLPNGEGNDNQTANTSDLSGTGGLSQQNIIIVATLVSAGNIVLIGMLAYAYQTRMKKGAVTMTTTATTNFTHTESSMESHGSSATNRYTRPANDTILSFNNNVDFSTMSMNMETLVRQNFELSMPGYLRCTAGYDFEIGEMIAKGGGGSVHLGKGITELTNQFGEKLVIKVVGHSLNKSLHDFPDRVHKAFNQEVSLMHFLRREKHIAKLLGWCDLPAALVMKYYSYGSLDAFIRQNRLSRKDIVGFIADISHGVRVMHRNGFVHSDLKPQNVLIDEDLETGNVFCVLTDFGITQIVDEKTLLVKDFEVVEIRGLSVHYAAPEAFERFRSRMNPNIQGDLLMKVDLFSLAIVMLEIMSRRPPWSQ